MCYLCTQKIVNRLLFISSIVLLGASSVQGQTIMQRLKSRGVGQGVVNVYQSDSVTAIVNGKPAQKQASTPTIPTVKPAQKQQASTSNAPTVKPAQKQGSASNTPTVKPTQKQTPTSPQQREENKSRKDERDAVLTPPVVTQESTDSVGTLSRTALRGGHKMPGYRVQAFAGGNSRANRRQAENTRARVKQVLPMEPVYVHFLSPRWVCRVGNYRTYAEAQQVLHQLRDELGIQGANIVKCQIIVKEEP